MHEIVVPALQLSHGGLPCWLHDPFAHTQSVLDLAPVFAVVDCSGHTVHCTALDPREYCPWMQFLHAAEPGSLVNIPAPQLAVD